MEHKHNSFSTVNVFSEYLWYGCLFVEQREHCILKEMIHEKIVFVQIELFPDQREGTFL